MPAIRLSRRLDPLALQRAKPLRYPMLLQSSAVEARRGRHDLLLAFPQQGLRLDRDGITRDLDGRVLDGDFATLLDQAWRAQAISAQDEDYPGPFAGGWGLFFGYEYAGRIEPSLRLPPAPETLPLALALRCPAAIVVDRFTDTSWLVAEPGQPELLDQMQADIETCPALPEPPLPLGQLSLQEAPAEDYLAAVRRALGYIAAGDVFQINLSRRWQVEFEHAVGASDLYQHLRQANPAPFSGLLAWDDWAIVSSSPERLVAVTETHVETRPIAGTRPRLPDEDPDLRIRELVGDPKERAEHIMLIDLERNDLGRICQPGSVEVDELMAVESYAHVHHIVSNVRGRLRAGITPAQIVQAVFPGGSITGCPKVRCMQLVAELEGQGRGAYTGAFGWLAHDGRMDLNILIRSLVLQGRTASFRAGAGIVADSVPERELAETRAKARGLLRAFGVLD